MTAYDAKDNFSVKSEPLIMREPELEVGEAFGFPALYILLGVCNKLCDSLEKVWPDFHLWPEKLNLVKETYHGKCYEVSKTEFNKRIGSDTLRFGGK